MIYVGRLCVCSGGIRDPVGVVGRSKLPLLEPTSTASTAVTQREDQPVPSEQPTSAQVPHTHTYPYTVQDLL